MDKVSARFAQLQKNVGRCHATAAALEPGTDGRQAAFDALLAAADSLLAYDAKVPGLRQEPARRTTQAVVLWTSRGTAAVAALTAAAVIPGWAPWGWLLLVLPVLAVALNSGLTAKPLPKGRPHQRFRASAILLAACALLLGAVALGVLSAWWVIGVLGCAAASFATGLPDDPNTNRSTR
ncbi:hypothetical protein [Kitasatospora sp. NBC_01300]|uniref:hypothetical protein n=1 Tax=Kitasatospora sp. NBC_01300 TaxID=2903574 RepID=UPI002F9075E6|nr:hypothetical protein OG556_40540 [Kitasatospora sp. NBC_01300]